MFNSVFFFSKYVLFAPVNIESESDWPKSEKGPIRITNIYRNINLVLV